MFSSDVLTMLTTRIKEGLTMMRNDTDPRVLGILIGLLLLVYAYGVYYLNSL